MKRKSKLFSKKDKPFAELRYSIRVADRSSQKKAFAEMWLQESQYHKYRYIVESCDDGSQIYITRPTRSHGLDFAVGVQGFQSTIRNSRSERPAHEDVFDDLKRKIAAKPYLAEELHAVVGNVYDCVEPPEAIRKHPKVKQFNAGLPIDKLLRIIKWLFIEQDLTYWLGTGRNMLMCAIEKHAFRMKVELFEENEQ